MDIILNFIYKNTDILKAFLNVCHKKDIPLKFQFHYNLIKTLKLNLKKK